MLWYTTFFQQAAWRIVWECGRLGVWEKKSPPTPNLPYDEVEYLHFFNDHLIDDTLSHERRSRIASDHGQVVVTIRMREER